MMLFFFFKQKTAYEMRISDWSSDVCSSDLRLGGTHVHAVDHARTGHLHGGQVHRTVVGQVDRRGAAQGNADGDRRSRATGEGEIGRASCRERVCQYV